MIKEEIKQLEERVYAIGSSLFPIDIFFNDIRDNKDPKYNKDKAYEDLKLIVDEIYRLRDREKAKKIKKPTSIEDMGYYCCPVCDGCNYNPLDDMSWRLSEANYCPECGQKLDWGENNE